MKLHSLGIDFRHDKDFLIDRPNGSGDNLIIIFKTTAVVRQNGIVQTVPAAPWCTPRVSGSITARRARNI